MIYLDNGATSLHKPPQVRRAVLRAMMQCANPGRGGYREAMQAARVVYRCREEAGRLFRCLPDQVVLTHNCTHGLNLAIRTLVKPGDKVILSGFEHNAVTRPLHALGCDLKIAGRKLFDQADTLTCMEDALKQGASTLICTHVSNVFGYILPLEQISDLCRRYHVPLIVDAAQSAGALELDFSRLEAQFLAMPGHKGLLGPQGTGLLLCAQPPEPLLYGGTGSDSIRQRMPEYLPDRAEAGTLNVPGIAGLAQSLHYLNQTGVSTIAQREHRQLQLAIHGLKEMGYRVFSGEPQLATVSFLPPMDCEEAAQQLARRGIAVRAGLHCAPLAHESAGTLHTGTLRVSFGHDATKEQTEAFLRAAATLGASTS